jgi:TIR domain
MIPMVEETPVPTVFISYSHEDADHKRWVLGLAETLRTNGVEVLFDAWDLRPGDDVPKFMERGVRDAKRVLMICTEAYVAKANDGTGGVGYEAMIVTGELIRDLGTAKFIPIVRQKGAKPVLPTSVSTRFWINLSEGADTTGEMDKLLRELHQVPPEKPPLGPSPFSRAAEGASRADAPSLPGVAQPIDPTTAYQRALNAARAGDMLSWRRIVSEARNAMRPILSEWWSKYGNNIPGEKDTLVEQSMEGVTAFAPLTAIALAGIASGAPKFQHQAGLLEDVLNPAEWNRGGLVVRTELPETGAFVYQALHGAMCLHVGNLGAAMTLAGTQTVPRTSSNALALWQRHDIVMWPQALGHEATRTWKVGLDLASRWPWLLEVFGDQTDYQAALYGYYVSLNTLEYVERLRADVLPKPTDNLRLYYTDIPPIFENAPDDAKRRGYQLNVDLREEYRGLWASMSLNEQSIREHWVLWMTVQNAARASVYPLALHNLGFQRLVPDILGGA